MNKKCKIKFEGVNKIILTLVVVFLYSLLFIGSDGGGVSTVEVGDGNESISAPKNGISFQENEQGNNFGFDAMKDKVEAYASIKTQSSTAFNVIVKNHPNGATAASFNTALLKIAGAGQDGKFPLENDVTTELTITSLNSDGAVTVDIEGCTGELAHNDDCYILENELYVKIYEEKKCDVANIALLNYVSFNTDGIKDYINSILKQAVYQILDLNVTPYPYFDKSQYDINNNGCLDLWVDAPAPADDEMDEMQTAASGYGIFTSTMPGIAIISDNIKTHWGLKYEILIPGANSIELKEAAYIEIGYTLYIGPLPGEQGDGEPFYVCGKNGNSLHVQKEEFDASPLSYAHPIEHTVQSTTHGFHGKTAGGTNFAVVRKNVDFYTITHEFLHLKTSGILHHVTDTSNIMYPDVSKKHTRLRYRELTIPGGGTEMQWSTIQEAYF